MPYRYNTDSRILSLEDIESINETYFVCSTDSAPRKLLGSVLLSLATNGASNVSAQTIDIEGFIMAYQNALDGFNRFMLEYDTNAQVTIKQGSYGIGAGGVYYEIGSDQTASLDDDLDEGSKAADKAYNLFVGLDNEEEVFFAFSLSNSPPANMFNGLLVGFINTDSASLIRKFRQVQGQLSIEWPSTTVACTANTPFSKDISHLVPSGFSAMIGVYLSGNQFTIGYSDGTDIYGSKYIYIAGEIYTPGGTLQLESSASATLTLTPAFATLWT